MIAADQRQASAAAAGGSAAVAAVAAGTQNGPSATGGGATASAAHLSHQAAAGAQQQAQASGGAKQKISSANLLSPNAALEQQASSNNNNCQVPSQQRRKSTLSANGFFIDYSCTRRRSSARPETQPRDPLQAAIERNQFLRNVISPAAQRRPSAMVAGSLSAGANRSRSRSSYAGPANSAACAAVAASHAHLLQVGGVAAATAGGAGRMAAGSRKTSIFDPAGHSLVAGGLASSALRRKSTMVTGGGGAPVQSAAIAEAATMLAVSRQAAALQSCKKAAGSNKTELVQRVPVIGCSPTSIRASLAALDETRRYEKLLRKLNRHQKRKEKEKEKLSSSARSRALSPRRPSEAGDVFNRQHIYDYDESADELEVADGSLCDIDLLESGDEDEDDGALMSFSSDDQRRASDNRSSQSDSSDNRPGRQLSLRRKSMRALKDAAALLNKASSSARRRHSRKRRHKRRLSKWAPANLRARLLQNATEAARVDGLSISSTLSFASSQTSLPSMNRFLDDLSLYDDDDDDDDNYEEDDYEEEEEEDAGGQEEQAEVGYCNADEDARQRKLNGRDCSPNDDECLRESSSAIKGGRRLGGECYVNTARSLSADSADLAPRASNQELDNGGGGNGGQALQRQRQAPGVVGNINELIARARDGGESDNNNDSRALARTRETTGNKKERNGAASGLRGSLVRRAMRKIAAKLGATNQQQQPPPPPQEANKGAPDKVATTTAAAAAEQDNQQANNNEQAQQKRRRRRRSSLAPVEGLAERRASRRPLTKRRRSLSVSGGLNYWHYYYYLRDNSLDAADELPVTATVSQPDCVGASAGCGPAAVAGTPMGETERRARLYVNYSLARLEILNCNSDPVAKLADKLAQMAALRQQEDEWSMALGANCDNEQQQQQQSSWNQLFDFANQSTDVSLTLSTSSTTLGSSSTTRNSSSMSSPVSTVSSSLACIVNVRPSTTSGTTPTALKSDEREREHEERQQRRRRRHLAAEVAASAAAVADERERDEHGGLQVSSSSTSSGGGGGAQNPQSIGGTTTATTTTTSSTASSVVQMQQSLASQWHRPSAVLAQRGQDAFEQPQPSHSISSHSIGGGHYEQQQQRCSWQQQQCQGAPAAAFQVQADHYHHHHHLGASGQRSEEQARGQFEPDDYAVARRAPAFCETPPAAAAAQSTADHQQRELHPDQPLDLSGRFERRLPPNLTSINDPFTCAPGPRSPCCDDKLEQQQQQRREHRKQPPPAPLDEPEDDFERFSRMNQHGASSPTRSERSLGALSQRSSLAPSSSTPGGQHFGRDAHFRFSVKAAKGERRRPSSARRHHQVAGASGEQSPGLSPGMGVAASRRSSRTFLSWDRLEAPPVGVSGGLTVRHATGADSAQQGGGGANCQLEASNFQAANRRSFRQPRGQIGGKSSQVATTAAVAAPSEARAAGSWRLSYFVSPSRSFLFQRKQSTTPSSQQQQQPTASSKQQQKQQRADYESDNNNNAPKVGARNETERQRREADELLGEFEAQMSEAASLAAASSAGKQQGGCSRRASTKRRHHNQPQQQQQLHLACKSGPPSRSSSSSLSSRSFASFSQEPSGHHHHQNSGAGQQPSLGSAANQQQQRQQFQLQVQPQRVVSNVNLACERIAQIDWRGQQQQQPANQVWACGEAGQQGRSLRAAAANRNESDELSSGSSTSGQQSRRALQVPGGNRRAPSERSSLAAQGASDGQQQQQQQRVAQQPGQAWTLANNNTTLLESGGGGVNNHKPARSVALLRGGQGDKAPVATGRLSSGAPGQRPELLDEWPTLAVTQTSCWPPAPASHENNGRRQQAPAAAAARGHCQLQAVLRPPPLKEATGFCQQGEPTPPYNFYASQGFLQQHQQPSQQQMHQLDGRESNSLRARAHSTGAGSQQRQAASAAAATASHLVARAAAAASATSQTNQSMQMLSSLACREAAERQHAQLEAQSQASSSRFGLAYGRSLSSLVAGAARGRNNQRCDAPPAGSASAQTSPNRREHFSPRRSFKVTASERQAAEMQAAAAAAASNVELKQVEQENQAIHLHALNMLRKNSFNCTVLGARQVGKRTIVICFVKLLNEFKLAADEYKKERMLTKLVECSERLQELTSRQEEQQQQQLDEQLANRQRRASRLNSWLPGGERMKSLLNLSPGGKRRLNSVANLWGGREQTSGGSSRTSPNRQPAAAATTSGGHEQHQMVVLAPADDDCDQGGAACSSNAGPSQRRHTTFDGPASFDGDLSASTSKYLNVGSGGQQGGSHLLQASWSSNTNKSDSNIHYGVESQAEAAGATVHQLQVPSFDSLALRKHSDPTSCRSSSQPVAAARRRAPSCSPSTTMHERRLSPDGGSVFLSTSASNGDRSPNNRRRHTTLSTDILNASGGGHAQQRQRSQSRAVCNVNESERLRARGAAGANSARRPSEVKRNQSICLSKRSKRLLLSLKELNRRKFAIKFNTRRQISDAYLEQLEIERKKQLDAQQQQQRQRASHRRSILLQLVQATALPDTFIVVYSISDRNSFAYAKSLVKQLRARRSEIPLPITLVANKSDLERNREITSEEGRVLARSFACKFIEISCTIGFNLDTLLVGLRTQLVLRHHVILNSILRPGFRYKPATNRKGGAAATAKQGEQGNHKEGKGTRRSFRERQTATVTAIGNDDDKNGAKTAGKAAGGGDNILMRFYKRYVIDNYEQNSYDCDNFSKL